MPESLRDGARQIRPALPSLPPRLFSAVELRLFRYTAVLLSLVALSALVASIAWTFSWILDAFYNLLLPLALAGVLALVLHPVVAFLVRRFRLPRLLAVTLLLAVFLFFWGTALSGIIGMVLAVPLTAFFVAIWTEIKASLKHSLSSQDARA